MRRESAIGKGCFGKHMLCQTPPADAESTAKVSSLRTELDGLPSQMSLQPAPETNIILTTGKQGPPQEPSHPSGGVEGRCKDRFTTPNADCSVILEDNR